MRKWWANHSTFYQDIRNWLKIRQNPLYVQFKSRLMLSKTCFLLIERLEVWEKIETNYAVIKTKQNQNQTRNLDYTCIDYFIFLCCIQTLFFEFHFSPRHWNYPQIIELSWNKVVLSPCIYKILRIRSLYIVW